MKSITNVGLLVVCLAVTGFLTSVRAEAQEPRVLPFAGVALDINERGDVVGYDSAYQAFVWTADGRRLPLGSLPGLPLCEAAGINNPGTVVGWCWGDGVPASRAFVWTADGGMQDIGPGLALAINDAGEIAGGGNVTADGRQEAWRWVAGQRQLLGLSGTQSAAVAITERGAMAVSGPSPDSLHVYRWTPSAGLRDTGITGYGLGINDDGAIVSSASWSWNPYVIEPDDRVREIPMWPGWIGSATDIADVGLVVGTATDVVSERTVAWVWRDGEGPVRLGGEGSAANAVNQRGEVAGSVIGTDGLPYPAVWTLHLSADLQRRAVLTALSAQLERGLVRGGPAKALRGQLERLAQRDPREQREKRGDEGGAARWQGHVRGLLQGGHLPAWDDWFVR